MFILMIEHLFPSCAMSMLTSFWISGGSASHHRKAGPAGAGDFPGQHGGEGLEAFLDLHTPFWLEAFLADLCSWEAISVSGWSLMGILLWQYFCWVSHTHLLKAKLSEKTGVTLTAAAFCISLLNISTVSPNHILLEKSCFCQTRRSLF